MILATYCESWCSFYVMSVTFVTSVIFCASFWFLCYFVIDFCDFFTSCFLLQSVPDSPKMFAPYVAECI